RTPRLIVGPEHEVVDEELRASPEKIRQRGASLIGLESILLADRDPRQFLTPLSQLVAEMCQFLLALEQLHPCCQPLFTCSGLVRCHTSYLLLRVTIGFSIKFDDCRPRNKRNAGCRNHGSDKCGGISMDSMITAAARALAAGDPLGALKRVALRDDPPAL